MIMVLVVSGWSGGTRVLSRLDSYLITPPFDEVGIRKKGGVTMGDDRCMP